MKRLVVLAAVLVVSYTQAPLVLAGEIGPVEPYAAQGNMLLAVAYAYGSSTLSHRDDDFTIRQNQVFVEALYNRIGTVESCLSIGAADARTTDTDPDFRGSPAVLVSGRFKWLAWSDGTFGMGPFFQVTDALPAFKDSDQKIKDFSEILGGLCFQAKAGPAEVYGGPLAYYATAGYENGGRDVNLRQKHVLGGYGGIMTKLPWGLYAHLEGQYKGEGSVAANITWMFTSVPLGK